MARPVGRPRRTVPWPEIVMRAKDIKLEVYRQTSIHAAEIRSFGVPRGGCAVAALVGTPVSSPDEADVIVDDVIDSGRTRARYGESHPTTPFLALFDQPTEWLVFPWERSDDADEEDHVARLLELVGEDPNRDGLKETPARVIRSLHELTAGYRMEPAAILKKTFRVDHDSMVIVRDLPFWSLCEHHMLPFHGAATIAYIPGNGGPDGIRVVGLSKLARLLDAFARRLQVQERMTDQIAQAIQDHLAPVGVGVLIRARHLCMEMRGARSGGETVTSSLRGAMRTDATARAEFLALARATAG